MKNRTNRYVILLVAALLSVMMAGCGGGTNQPESSGPETTVDPAGTEDPDTTGGESDAEMESLDDTAGEVDFDAETIRKTLEGSQNIGQSPGSEGGTGAEGQDAAGGDYDYDFSIFEDILEKYGNQGDNDGAPAGSGSGPETAPEPGAAAAPTSVEAIAAIGGLEATCENTQYYCAVFIDDEELNQGNPYGVNWDYGKDYEAYIGMADWRLVFDAKYYKETFPMLALQYHNNDALLLRHFQTVGIHEGRQASEKFNVAAYMANADPKLRSAFGENYECYYLYYMLHQDTEASVKTTGNYSKQLTAKLTAVQKIEFKYINKYRAEVNSDPVVFDSEMAAFADFRAYMDSTEGWLAHDGLYHMRDNGELYNIFVPSGIRQYAENKNVSGTMPYKGVKSLAKYVNYKASQPHYEAMVNNNYKLVGCGNSFTTNTDYAWNGTKICNTNTLDTYASAVNTALNH